MEPTNRDRAKRAEQALLATHSETVDADGGDYYTGIADLMADLLHLAHQKGYDTKRVISLAQLHFDAEVEDEEEDEGFGHEHPH